MKVGINLSSNVDWQTGRYWLDLKNALRPWGSVSKPYEPVAFALSPDGYPLQDFGGFAELRNYPGGLYAYSYSGSGVLTWMQGVAVSANSGRAGTVVVNGDSGSLMFKVTGVNPADPFYNLTIRRTATGEIFDPDFLKSLAPFPVLRFMDWQHMNYPVVREWKDRPLIQHQQTVLPGSPGKGVSLDYCLDLAVTSGAAAWLNIPHTASDDYVRQMADLVKRYKVPVYLEFSNEPWNGIFPAYKYLVAEAAGNTALTAADPNARLYQHVVWKLLRAAAVFRSAGVDTTSVLCGQAENPWFVEEALKYAKARMTAAPDVIGYADYHVTTEDFPKGYTYCVQKSLRWVKQYRALADQYGVRRLACYEAGQHLIGAKPEFLAAQTSPEMRGAYKAAMADFDAVAGPDSLYMAFASPAPWGDGRDGYWGLSQKLGETTPKLDAVLEAAAVSPPPPPLPPAPVVQSMTVTVTADGKEVCRYDGPRAGVVVFTVTNRG